MLCLAWAFFDLSPFSASVRGVAFQDGLEVSARQGKRWGEKQREGKVFCHCSAGVYLVSSTWCLEKRLDPECKTNKLKKERKCNVAVLQSCSISLAQWSLRLQNEWPACVCQAHPGSLVTVCKQDKRKR